MLHIYSHAGPLAAALASGGATGSVGAVDLSPCLDTAPLDSAIARSLAIGCISEGSSRLLSLAQLLRRVRGAAVAGGWVEVLDAIASAGAPLAQFSVGLPPAAPAVAELTLLAAEAAERRILELLTATLASRAGSGLPPLQSAAAGHNAAFNASAVSTAPLDAVLGRVEELGGPVTATGITLRHSVAVLRALRAALVATGVGAGQDQAAGGVVVGILESARSAPLADAAKARKEEEREEKEHGVVLTPSAARARRL